MRDQRKIQCVASHARVGGEREDFYDGNTSLRIGDIVSITGFPGRSDTGELSIYATSLPRLLAPCLHQLPDSLDNPEKLKQNRHLDLLVHPQPAHTLKLRSRIIQQVRKHLTSQDFTEVQTPILSYSAGGAIAKPFLTTASSTHQPLALRIAPELWLKRLLIGGLDRVFELGPQFRNEGVDSTHNPEFTTCELYISFGRLDDVITLTEELLASLERLTRQLTAPGAACASLPPLDPDLANAFAKSFPRLEFIPTLETALGEPLPVLDGRADKAVAADLHALAARHGVPTNPTASPAKILDKLASAFIEPLCYNPTWIIHHPECMAPLAKSRVRGGRRVSVRVELFVKEWELVNAYEEENSPWEQRRKLVRQAGEAGGVKKGAEGVKKGEEEGKQQDAEQEEEDVMDLDEKYCEALEWGLPPTAGWGMGIDRLIMLFSGQEKITDVMAFGGLRGAALQGSKKPLGGGGGGAGKRREREQEMKKRMAEQKGLDTQDGDDVLQMVRELAESLKDGRSEK